MALSGRISTTLRGREYRIDWSASQNIAGNYSTVTCKHYLINDATFSLYINGRSNTCTVGGVSDDFTSDAISTGGGSTIHLGTTTHKVNHNADGSKGVTIKGVFNIQATLSGTYYSSLTASGSVTLDKIPRAATITSAPNFTHEDNPTIKYSNAAGSVVDELMVGIGLDGANNDDIEYRAISETGTSYTFELTDDERELIRETAKNDKSISAIFYLRTKIGNAYYYHSATKTLTIANAAPTLAPTVKDSNATTKALTGDEAKFIKGHSSAAYTIGASAKKQATIKSQKVTCGDKSATTASGTLAKVEGAEFTFSVTDSRGHTATKKLTKTLIDYVPLTCSMKVGTPTADGKCAMSISGNCFNGSFGAVANTLQVQYRQSTDGGSTWGAWVDAAATLSGNGYSAEVAITGLDYQQAYTFQARAVDKLATVNTATKTVKATPVFDWGEDDFNFNVPVDVQGALSVSGHINAGNYIYMNNNKYLHGKSADGASNLVMAGINSSNQMLFGYGSYNGSIGSAYYDGNNVFMRSKGGIYLTSPNAGISGRAYGVNKVLVAAGAYMNSSQTLTFSEPVSAQPHGIVLVWSKYDNGSVDSDFSYFFVPKHHVQAHNMCGIYCHFLSPWYHMSKYVYIADTYITGHDKNDDATLSVGGVTVSNTQYILRYVIGV
jgi:hypothetical protein